MKNKVFRGIYYKYHKELENPQHVNNEKFLELFLEKCQGIDFAVIFAGISEKTFRVIDEASPKNKSERITKLRSEKIIGPWRKNLSKTCRNLCM